MNEAWRPSLHSHSPASHSHCYFPWPAFEAFGTVWSKDSLNFEFRSERTHTNQFQCTQNRPHSMWNFARAINVVAICTSQLLPQHLHVKPLVWRAPLWIVVHFQHLSDFPFCRKTKPMKLRGLKEFFVS